jgi:hypothetical protein
MVDAAAKIDPSGAKIGEKLTPVMMTGAGYKRPPGIG